MKYSLFCSLNFNSNWEWFRVGDIVMVGVLVPSNGCAASLTPLLNNIVGLGGKY